MTELVGVLNITPDSFSDGGSFVDPAVALNHAEQLFKEGATFVDVGAEATNPYSEPISPDEEWRRLKPVLGPLMEHYPNKISVDTRHAAVVEHIVAELGTAFILNDITGMADPRMVELAAKHGLTCIVSHLPQSAAGEPHASHKGELVDDVEEVRRELLESYDHIVAAGVAPENIILDPGIGFGKTPRLNRELLEFPKFVPGKRVMIGYSKKRFLGEGRFELETNLEAGKVAVAAGAAYLRVHDVAGHRPLILRSS